jgi:4-hydroxythreonine-4-phosphate dehydrogenase
MKQYKKIAISIGDLNGVGIEIALKAHNEVSKKCTPIYCVDADILKKASTLLNIDIPKDMKLQTVDAEVDAEFIIKPKKTTSASGLYSYKSFVCGVSLCEEKKVDAVVTMPIHKEAWMMAGLTYKGHTDFLRQHFKQDAIMMLGCKKMFVALYTEHIPLRDVASTIKKEKIYNFLLDLHKSIGDEKVAVLGLNPHAGDNGVLVDEEKEIDAAIQMANSTLKKELFYGSIVPDIAFTPHFRENFNYFVAMYHDQGLAPLKALYFDESINISLNLPIIRTSVDHGTAFDIAYTNQAKTKSYINAIESALELSKR